VCVCDDELIARMRVLRLLGELSGIDVVLLDIHMPEIDGLSLARQMPETLGGDRPYLIFLTAHPNHALEAFEVGAIDYLLKPVDAPRLEKALDRARTFLDRDEPRAPPTAIAKLPVQTKAGVVLLAPNEITHAVLESELVTIATADKTLITDFTLGELEAKLPSPPFVRVHRRAILNVERTTRFEPLPSGGYLAHVEGGRSVDVSRAVARKLRRTMGI